MTASAFQVNAWVDLIRFGSFEQRVGNAQRVTDWLRARARAFGPIMFFKDGLSDG